MRNSQPPAPEAGARGGTLRSAGLTRVRARVFPSRRFLSKLHVSCKLLVRRQVLGKSTPANAGTQVHGHGKSVLKSQVIDLSGISRPSSRAGERPSRVRADLR